MLGCSSVCALPWVATLTSDRQGPRNKEKNKSNKINISNVSSVPCRYFDKHTIPVCCWNWGLGIWNSPEPTSLGFWDSWAPSANIKNKHLCHVKTRQKPTALLERNEKEWKVKWNSPNLPSFLVLLLKNPLKKTVV